MTTASPSTATTPAASSSARPNNASRRPRTLAHASPTVIGEPNTARPTMTVSMPLSSTPASQLTRRLAPNDADQPPTTAPVSSSGSPVTMSPKAVMGPNRATSEMICRVTTTMAVNPSVAFGLARM
ncbi:Uncharacterised protein [Mycobacterium tuberculosis]|nr:Uncharacterised protein [Mycobacterium tuberculosis]